MLRSAVASSHAAELPLRFAPPPMQAHEIARLLMQRYGESAGSRKAGGALEALLRRLRLAHYVWDNIDAADRLDVAWVLWEGTVPPAEHEKFLRDFLAWLEKPWRRLQAARLAASWAAAFDPSLRSIRIAGEWLAKHAALLPEPWAGLVVKYKIFSLEHGPKALAEAFLAGEETAAEFFRRLRLPTRAAEGGIALETLVAATSLVECRLKDEPHLAAKLCDLALAETGFRADATAGRGTRRAAAIRVALAEALLLPWRKEAPPAAIKTQISTWLLRHYGDARVVDEHWAAMRPPAAAMMRRWLTEHTIAAYFRLARQASSADRKRLAEREEFWMACIDQIDETWLLGNSRNIAALGLGHLAHGGLTAVRVNQAALLMRIGGLTVLEASDRASENVWLHGNALAPALYRGVDQPYLPAALANGADFSSAYNSRQGNDPWQRRLAEFIARHSGRRLAA
jgi:hypothetical protein